MDIFPGFTYYTDYTYCARKVYGCVVLPYGPPWGHWAREATGNQNYLHISIQRCVLDPVSITTPFVFLCSILDDVPCQNSAFCGDGRGNPGAAYHQSKRS
jgi:hypothetical protein